MNPHVSNSYLAPESPMVAIPNEPIERTPLELHARTLAASALTEAGVDRTPEAMDYLTDFLIDKAAFGAAVWVKAHETADAGDAITKAKQAGQFFEGFPHDPPGD